MEQGEACCEEERSVEREKWSEARVGSSELDEERKNVSVK